MTSTLLLVGTAASTAAVAQVLREDFGDIVETPDGASAVRAALTVAPDVVAVDLPVTDGQARDALTAMHHVSGPDLPVMLLVDDMAASADLLGTLAADAMTKPWVSGLLRARMRSWLIRTRLGQSKRLAAVERTGLPDKPTSEALDRLTKLIARILNAPVALISLVDANRQFFAAQVGLAEPWASARQTPLTHSFCQHVAATDAPLVVADARDHPLLKDNRAIPELNVVAYAGVPLAGDEGQTLGSVCIIDSNPRIWTETELDILREFAGIASAMIAERTAAHA